MAPTYRSASLDCRIVADTLDVLLQISDRGGQPDFHVRGAMRSTAISRLSVAGGACITTAIRVSWAVWLVAPAFETPLARGVDDGRLRLLRPTVRSFEPDRARRLIDALRDLRDRALVRHLAHDEYFAVSFCMLRSKWSLQCLRLIPRCAHPHVSLFVGGQDHRHRLGMDRLHHRIRRSRPEAVHLMSAKSSGSRTPDAVPAPASTSCRDHR